MLVVVLAGFATVADSAFASHFRYSHVTWQQTGASSADFTISSSFRRCGYSGSAPDGCPAVGDVITEFIGGTQLDFGDGSYSGTLDYRVTAINPSEDWLIGLAIDPGGGGPTDNLIGHTYSGAGPFTAEIFSCCTIGGLNNNTSGEYRDQTLVDLASEDESPVSSVPPIVTVGKPGVQTFPVPAIDSGGETLRWRLATDFEACGSCSAAQPPGLTIDPNTGVVTWDTTSVSTGLWFVSVVIESLNGAGNVVGSSQVTFLINVVTGSNNPPDWEPPTPAQGSEFTVNAGSTLNISLQASDPDSGDTVHIDNLGLPPGATFSSTDGNPATGTFSWTPTSAQAGDYLVTFTAQDNGTPQQSAVARTFVIHVTSGPGPPDKLTLSPASATNTAGDEHCVTATVVDASDTPTPDVTVDFSVSGANTANGSSTTDANGEAQFCYTGTTAGEDTITATAQGGSNPSDTATKTYVADEPATLDLTPASATNKVDEQHCVTATVADQFGNPTGGVTVGFTVSGSNTLNGSGTTDSDGRAQFCYTSALPGGDTITATAQGGSNPSDTATKTWAAPLSTRRCKITNGGRITAQNDDRASFGGNAHASNGSSSPPRGKETYQDHGPAQDMFVKGNTVKSVVCSSDNTQGSIFASGRVDGVPGFQIRIDVKDLDEPGKSDTYRIRVSNGYDSGEQVLEGGNIQIHK